MNAKKAVERKEELEYLIAAPEIVADKNYWLMLTKEHSLLVPIAEIYYRVIDKKNTATDDLIQSLSKAMIAALNYQFEEAELEICGLKSMEESWLLCESYKDFAYKNGLSFDFEDSKRDKGIYKIRLKGVGAYSILKQENGIHLFDKKRIEVLLYPLKNIDTAINESDIRIDYFHSNGAGGQNVNKVESAIRATHLPTNIAVVCQDERSQLKNKERALSNLKKRIAEHYQKQNKQSAEKARQDAKKSIQQGIIAREYDLGLNQCKNGSALLNVKIINQRINFF